MWEEVKTLPPEQKKKVLCEEVEEILILSCIDGMERTIEGFPTVNMREDLRKVVRTRPELEEFDEDEILDLLLTEILTEYSAELQENLQKDDLKSEILRFTEKEIRQAGEVDIPSIVNSPTKGETFRDRIINRINEETLTPDTLKVIVETESHRCEEDSAYRSAKQIQKKTGLTPYKVWHTMEDDRVRLTHDYIDHDIVGIDEYFVTFDGDMARWPGDFQLAENNCGCRCWLEFIWI